ncbi:hypothetical protein P5784_29390, partial [Bacillus cereus]|uniref:hypothetical protein n=1 Tax=Bacillus cereus TaxID=1396 RepID=UPI00240772AF
IPLHALLLAALDRRMSSSEQSQTISTQNKVAESDSVNSTNVRTANATSTKHPLVNINNLTPEQTKTPDDFGTSLIRAGSVTSILNPMIDNLASPQQQYEHVNSNLTNFLQNNNNNNFNYNQNRAFQVGDFGGTSNFTREQQQEMQMLTEFALQHQANLQRSVGV